LFEPGLRYMSIHTGIVLSNTWRSKLTDYMYIGLTVTGSADEVTCFRDAVRGQNETGEGIIIDFNRLIPIPQEIADPFTPQIQTDNHQVNYSPSWCERNWGKAHPVVPGSPICGMRMPCGGRLRRAREGIEWLRAISVSTVPRGPKGRRTATGMPTSGSRHPKTGNPAPFQIWPATPIC
jgi:hypothetical protein